MPARGGPHAEARRCFEALGLGRRQLVARRRDELGVGMGVATGPIRLRPLR